MKNIRKYGCQRSKNIEYVYISIKSKLSLDRELFLQKNGLDEHQLFETKLIYFVSKEIFVHKSHINKFPKL